MPATFSRTLRSLSSNRSGRRGLAFIGIVLLAAWSAWMALGQVTVYQMTERARVEVGSAAHPVATPVAGRVVETHLAVGREVVAGEVLVVLDAELQRRALDEACARRQSLTSRLQAMRREIAAVEDAAVVEQKAREAAKAEARAHVDEAHVKAEFARLQADISVRLRASKVASELEHYNYRAQAEGSRAALFALEAARTRLDRDRELQEKERLVRLAKLRREAVELEGQAAIEQATIHRLEYDISLRCIRAPVTGQLGEAAEVRVGTVLQAADRLGAVVPRDPPRAVAFYPAGAVGRIQPGQPARLRLDAYPWAQYGTVAATVAKVGNEPAGGLIRVELALKPEPTSAIALGHGLPGCVEIEVEQVSPAVMLLRAAGQHLARRKEPTAGNDEAGTARGGQ
jgi:membrane fusion protein (multidrug efflux system)